MFPLGHVGIGTHLIPACFDHGIPEVMAASLLAVMGVFDFIGTTASGVVVNGNKLTITLVLRPASGPSTAPWRDACRKVTRELQAYLMGR